MDEWISVEDRLPEDDEIVLCYGRGPYYNAKAVMPGRYQRLETTEGLKASWKTTESDGYGGYEEFELVTHWRRLPEPPKDK